MNQCTYASSNTALSPPHIEHIFFYDPSTVLCGYLWLPTVEMMMAVGYIVQSTQINTLVGYVESKSEDHG